MGYVGVCHLNCNGFGTLEEVIREGKKGRLGESEEQNKNKTRKREGRMGENNNKKWEIYLPDEVHMPL